MGLQPKSITLTLPALLNPTKFLLPCQGRISLALKAPKSFKNKLD